MKIIALTDFWMSGGKGYERGKEYDVTQEVGDMFIYRELAERKAEEKKVEAKKK